jgi:hypothetical protein
MLAERMISEMQSRYRSRHLPFERDDYQPLALQPKAWPLKIRFHERDLTIVSGFNRQLTLLFSGAHLDYRSSE